MQVEHGFEGRGDRYRFDTGACSAEKGYLQVVTGQDAWYSGMWLHPGERRIVSYSEGDVTVETAESDAELAGALRRHADWHAGNGHRFRIDPGNDPGTRGRLEEIGVGDLVCPDPEGGKA